MKIRNECTFSPRGLIRTVERSLGWIDPLDLHGVSFIRLLDDLPKPTDRSPRWHKDLKKRYDCLTGLYYGKFKNEPAHITLYIRNLYRGIPSLLQLTPLPTLVITETLAHEVGHHLISTRGYIFQPAEAFDHKEVVEEFCDRYAFTVVKKMLAKSQYRVSRWILKKLAGWYYDFASLDWNEKKYKKAAERFLTAFLLDRNCEDALYWHSRAKDAGNAEQIVGRERRGRVS
jgi:hypothetical protein